MTLVFKETAAAAQLYTYDDYRQLPEGAPCQLIGGELIMEPAPGTYHQIIAMKLNHQMVTHVLVNNLGLVLFAPVDVYLQETETYQPDLIYIASDRQVIIEPERINGAPDLVVEILSPSTAYYDLRKKFKVYESSGVKEYWIVDPEEKSIQVYKLHEDRFQLNQEAPPSGVVRSNVISGLQVAPEELF